MLKVNYIQKQVSKLIEKEIRFEATGPRCEGVGWV